MTESSEPTGTNFPQPIELPVEERATAVALHVQMLRFLATGILSACVDFGILWLLTQQAGLNQVSGKAISFILGTTTAYLINRRWTFRAEPSKRRFGAIVVLYGVTFALQVGLYSLLYWFLNPRLGTSMVEITMVLCFVIAQGVATTVNFIVQRTVIFRLI
ncbi:GtrA family protein [Naumannella halotolerans]|uniref:Putative flippase GtrA n=1 Tax=Naumannella halotolerans TaxID=993414 RepID=A0A4V3ENL1_9ACTN|nr:GtrA family protein [Naumannella halotolerans]TDT34118.1 putative flippase GtrA [Naumannella halotolerans]